MSERYLLDSHVFLWLAQDPSRVTPEVWKALENARLLYLSPLSIAELCIKNQQGRLPLPAAVEAEPAAGFRALAKAMGIEILPLDVEAAATLKGLPRHHGDPFDRMLIGQCLVDGLTLITHDQHMAAYDGLDILWT